MILLKKPTTNKEYRASMLISHQILAKLENLTEYSIRFIEHIKVKGKSKAVAVFEVLDGDELAVKEGKLPTKALFEEGLFLYDQQIGLEARNDLLRS